MFSFRRTGTFVHHRPFGFRAQILVVLIALAALGVHAQTSPAAEKNIIRGVVINQLTQAPIPRALVYSPDNRYATLTDGEGHFEFTLSKANTNPDSRSLGSFSVIGSAISSNGPIEMSGNHTLLLMARKPGFLDDPRDRREVRAAPGEDVTISLLPEALIKGRVTLSTGEPATGVSVQLFFRQVIGGSQRWMPSAGVLTNSAGEFRFAELRPGSYKIATREFIDSDPLTTLPGGQRYGFPPVYFPGASDFNSATTIQPTAGETLQADLALTRQPYYDVKIPVANSSDVNGGVGVSVRGQRGPGYSLVYNSGVQAIQGMLPTGNYVIEASTYGANAMSGSVNLRVAGGPAKGPPMTMVRSSSISLEVKEEFAEASAPMSASWSDGQHTYSIHGARLYLQAQVEDADDREGMRGGGSVRQPNHPNDDSLVIENLQPGRYWLRLTSSRGYVASATSGGIDVLHQPIMVGSASTIPVEITMRDDGGKIEGTIPTMAQSGTESSALLTSTWVHVWVYCIPGPNSAGQFETIGVSGDGKFHSRPIAPGDYLLLAFRERQPSLPYRDSEAMKAYESKGQVIQVSAGQTTSVQLQVIPATEGQPND